MRYFDHLPANTKCECEDSGCGMHEGSNVCECIANTVLYRIDTDDYTGTAMCDDCANDASLSGLYTEAGDPEFDEIMGLDEQGWPVEY